MKTLFSQIICGCLFAAAISLSACDNDKDVIEEKPIVPTPEPEPEVNLPEISGFGYTIGYGGNDVTGQDVDYSMPFHIAFSPKLADKALTAKEVSIYIDGTIIATKPWAEDICFVENMKNYSVGEHTVSVSSLLSCEGYKDTMYTFGETFSFYVFNEAPKHHIMLNLKSNHIEYGEIYTDPISGITIDSRGVCQGINSTSDADDSIVWASGEHIVYGGIYTDPISGITVDTSGKCPADDDIITFQASLVFDTNATNFDAEIDCVDIRWGSRDAEPSMTYSVPYKDMNDIDYIYVVYQVKGKKDGKEFSDNNYYEKTIYLIKSELDF